MQPIEFANILSTDLQLAHTGYLTHALCLEGTATLLFNGASFPLQRGDYIIMQRSENAQIVEAHACCHNTPALFNIICTAILGCLLLYALIKRFIPQHTDKTMETRLFKVEGMMCNHCRANVEKTLLNLPDVEEVVVDLASGTASVKGTVTDEAVIAAITASGYSAQREK